MSISQVAENIAGLDTLKNRFSDKDYICRHEFDELTAVCPVTELPDFYHTEIEYQPDTRLVELKSFKLYLNTFRNRQIIHEEITNEILEQLVKSISPKWLKIKNVAGVRGGISTTVSRVYEKS